MAHVKTTVNLLWQTWLNMGPTLHQVVPTAEPKETLTVGSDFHTGS